MKKDIFYLLIILLLILSLTNCNDNNGNGDCEDTETITDIIPGGSITLVGATLNDGIEIDDSRQIILGFNRILASENTEITLGLPVGTNQFTAEKDGMECPVDGATDCTGSLIVVNGDGPDGGILILDYGETSGTSLFTFHIVPPSITTIGNCDWEIDSPVTNGDIQFVRVIPEISITYTDTVYPGDCVTIDAAATAITEPPDYSPAPEFYYSWTQTSGPAVFLGEWNNSTIMFNAPHVYIDADMIFLLTITDDSGMTTTTSVTITILAL